MEKDKELENLHMQINLIIMELEKMIKKMEKENKHMKMVKNMKDNFRMIFSQELEN